MRTQMIRLLPLMLILSVTARAGQAAKPAAFRLRPCRTRAAGSVDPARAVLVCRSTLRASEPAHVRIVLGRKSRDVSMAIVAKEGVVVGPMVIARRYTRLLPAFCGDLNKDGRTDFVVMAQVPSDDGRPYCDVAFALSAKDGHRIVVMRRNVNPGARDFIDLGGRCGFVHTEVVGASDSCDHEGHAVRRLFEFDADGRAVASSRHHYPMTVHLAPPGEHSRGGVQVCASSGSPSPELPRRLVERSHPVATTVAQGDVD